MKKESGQTKTFIKKRINPRESGRLSSPAITGQHNRLMRLPNSFRQTIYDFQQKSV